MDQKVVKERVIELEQALHSLKRIRFAQKKDCDLKGSDTLFLLMIASIKDGAPVKPSELAGKSDVTLPAVTHHLNALEQAGLVQRTLSSDDKRNFLISLTDQGKEKVAKLRQLHEKRLSGLIEYLGEKDSQTLLFLVKKISEYLSKEIKDKTNA